MSKKIFIVYGHHNTQKSFNASIRDTFIDENKIDGIIATNTTVNFPELKSQNKNEKGGLSGEPLYDKSNDVISFISKTTKGKLPIIGVGGISTPEQAINKLRAGAHLVQ